MPSHRSSTKGSFGKMAAISVLALSALAGCIGPGGPRPTTPTYSGGLRPDPERPSRPEDPAPSAPVIERYADSRNAYQPRHVPREASDQIKRIAVILPFKSADPVLASYAKALFNAMQLALFDRTEARNVVLVAKDASSTDPRETARVAEDAIRDGAIAVLGPINASHVSAVAGKAAEVRAPVFTFSTDESVLNQGAYLLSLTPRAEIERVLDYARNEGVTRIVMFGPDTPYGRGLENTVRQEAAERGQAVAGIEYYRAGDPSPQDAARRLAAVIQAEHAANPNKVAVLIPERGNQLRTVASILRSVSGTNQREVRFLGTGEWYDPAIWRETSLEGGAFPSADPEALAAFEKRYTEKFGEAPPRIASFGYDAGGLIANLASEDRLDAAMIQRSPGFVGINGLYRFLSDGSAERSLSIMQLQGRNGARVIVPAATQFAPPNS
jgi:branched-chain amino acid transport system substrate-binding protein